MTDDDDRTLQARARLAGFLYLAVNAVYIGSLLAGMMGPEELRRPAVALGAVATASTIALAWSLYELLKSASPGLALLALLFRVAEATLYGVFIVFSLVALGAAAGPAGAGGAGPGFPMARIAQLATGQVGQVYFCFGSALFFYLLLKGRFIPRALAAFGLVASLLWLASALAQISAPGLGRYLRWFDAVFLATEMVTGLWLLIAGAGKKHRLAVTAA